MIDKTLWVFNEGGKHITISYAPWKWLRIWINFGHSRVFSWGTPPKCPWDSRVVRDITPILMALDVDKGPLTKLLGGYYDGIHKTSN